MAQLSPGFITDPNPNVLYDPIGVDRAVQARQTNALLQDEKRQGMAANEIEYLARAAQGVLGLSEAERPAAYSAAVADLQRLGFARNAPSQYDEPSVRRVAAMGTSAEKQAQYAYNQQGNNALLEALKKPSGTPGTVATPGATPGADTYEGSVIVTEGTGRNPRSSATGTGQFIDSTWRAFATANPQLFAGMTPDQVMAARNDPKLGQAAVTWLAQQNATEMKAQGVEPSGTSLRVAHWVGAGPAAKIMQAPDQTPVSSFLSPEAVAANPELATMTAGQMRQRFANVPNPSFLQPQQPGRVQVASADTGTRTDATTTPPAPGAQQPTQQPPQQQPQQQPQQPAQSGEPIPPPGQLTARQMAQYRALNPRTTDPKDSAAMLERFEQHNEQRRQHAAAATRQAQADTRLAQQDAAAAEQTNYNRAQDAKKEILAAEDRRIKEEDRQIKLKADQEAALRAGREDEAKALAAKALESKTRFDQSNTLRDEATKITETFRPVQESYERIGAAAAAGNSLGDLALIYTYTRLLDPATVHEEEVKRGMKAGGLAEYVSGWLARVTKGESLTPAVRQQFAEMGRKFYDVRKKGYEKELGAYRQLAEKFGLDPDSVAVSLARDQGPPPGMTVVIP